MLFISANGLLITGVRQAKDVHNEHTGQYVTTIPGIDVQFIHGGAPTWAAEQALVEPRFLQLWGGLPDGIDKRLFIFSFDTDKKAREEGWDTETQQEVEQFLLSHPDYGVRYLHYPEPEDLVQLPWPNYNDVHHAQVVKIAKEIGVDLREVLQFERRNRNRTYVIEKLEEELGDRDEIVVA